MWEEEEKPGQWWTGALASWLPQTTASVGLMVEPALVASSYNGMNLYDPQELGRGGVGSKDSETGTEHDRLVTWISQRPLGYLYRIYLGGAFEHLMTWRSVVMFVECPVCAASCGQALRDRLSLLTRSRAGHPDSTAGFIPCRIAS